MIIDYNKFGLGWYWRVGEGGIGGGMVLGALQYLNNKLGNNSGTVFGGNGILGGLTVLYFK